MEFTKNEFKEFRKDVVAAVKNLETKYGLSIETGNISYTDADFKMQLICKKSDQDYDKQYFEKNAVYYGLNPEDYGKKIYLDGKEFVFIGVSRTAKKYCCNVLRVSDNKEYGYTLEAIKKALGYIK